MVIALSVQSCELEELSQFTNSESGKRIWVFVQFNVPEEGDKIDSYWYFGQVSESLYRKIVKNKVESGFLLMSNVRYWGDDGLVHEYKDSEYTGELLFRIEDIRKIDVVRIPPEISSKSEEVNAISEDEKDIKPKIKRAPII